MTIIIWEGLYFRIYMNMHIVFQINSLKNQIITLETDNKTKFRNIEKLWSLSFIYQCFCSCLEIFLIEILRL